MNRSSETEVCIGVSEKAEVRELERRLTDFSDCRVWLKINTWDLDMQAAADLLKDRWARNEKRTVIM